MNKPIVGFEHIYLDRQASTTLLLLHGTGGDENDLLSLGEELSGTYNILSPRGKVDEDGMLRFFKRLSPGVFDKEDLKFRSTELGKFITEASKTYNFSMEGVVAVGFSNGASIALHLLASNPGVLSKAILLRPMSAGLPDEISDLSSCYVLALSGAMDTMIDSAGSKKITYMLQAKGAQVEFHELPGGHGLTTQDVVLAKGWLSKIGS